MKISIIIPAFNEAKTIENLLERVDKLDFSDLKYEKEIIIVDDFSTDGTRDILKDYSKKYKVIFRDQNGGKAEAVKDGFGASTGDVVIVQDADLEYNPEDIKSLLKKMVETGADAVYGSRFMGGNNKLFFIPHYYLGNRMLVAALNLLYFSNITDMETCYKLIKRHMWEKLDLKRSRFEIEPEITAKLLKMGCKIKEVPISYNPRGFGEGKKISIKDGIKALFVLVSERFRSAK